MINKIWLFAVFVLMVVGCSEHANKQFDTSSKPNIILFFVDDLGWQDTSVPFYRDTTLFNKKYHTPNMERLADQGMLFTNAYSASPVCTPTRSSIMTGQNPGRSNITNWTLRNDVTRQETASRNYPLRSPNNWKVEGVQPDSMLLPMLLKKQGYRTIHAGKAHFGAIDTEGANPKTLGFDVNIAGHAAGAPGSYLAEDKYGNERPDSPWGVPGLEQYYDSDTFLSEALTIEANKAVDQAVADGKPFFINMAHYAVHTPIMTDKRYFQDYLDEGIDSTEAQYASLIEGVDTSLGKIWQNLEEEGVAENTIILFMSDNGGLSAHARGETPMGTEANTHNKPLRSGKGSAYEGGIRVPMIVAWAKTSKEQALQTRFPIKAGSRNDTPVISEDFYPSILELAGVNVPENSSTDGQSFIPLLQDKVPSDEQRKLFWHYPHKWGPDGPGYDPFTAIRNGKWKLIYFYNGQIWELYNLETDIGESNNMISQNPDIAQSLAEKMKEWMEEVGAQLPISRQTGKPVPALSFAE
ncbi:sulfatase [Fodinibius salsisoli]|uniref:Sulfatase n=1 Tax=Fodinibius salsisoli TaxID=2820877 RepID=A0ABT3PPX1_9BACT|nr:sulfatase [Fodinibius salsisoli]MCW9707909.1 sulfatase [Fodinibius salsisoli]